MPGRCLANRMSKFPGLVDFIVDVVSAYGPGVTVLCAGYGRCDLLTESCDWAVMKALTSMPEVVQSVHFYDPACRDASPHRDAVSRDFAGTNVRVCETEDSLLSRYDFVMYFGAFEKEDFIRDAYKPRTSIAFVHVRTPGSSQYFEHDYPPARGMYMERHLDFPPEPSEMGPDPRIKDLVLEMQDRPFAFVELYRAERDFEQERYRFDREKTRDDDAFRSHIGPARYDFELQDGGAPAPLRNGVVGALAAITLLASLAASAMAQA
jgi:hypothetical protein